MIPNELKKKIDEVIDELSNTNNNYLASIISHGMAAHYKSPDAEKKLCTIINNHARSEFKKDEENRQAKWN